MPANIQTMPNDWKPDGSLGAFYSGVAQDQMNRANRAALEQASLENIIKSKEAALAQDDVNSQAYRDWRVRGAIGKDQTSSATGQFDQAILPTKTQLGVDSNKLKIGDVGLDQNIQRIDSMISALSSGNLAGQHSALSDLDDEDRKELLSTGDPIGTLTTLSNHLKNQRAGSVAVRGDILKSRTQGEEQRANTALSNQGALARTRETTASNERINMEQIAAGKYAKVLKDRFSLLVKTRPDLALAQIRAGLVTETDPNTGEPLNENTAKYWNEFANTLATSMNAKNQAASTNKADVSQFDIKPTTPPQVPGAVTPGGTSSLTPEQRAAIIQRLMNK